MPVNFCAPTNEFSGYGNAVKNFSKAFSMSGVRTRYMLTGNSVYATMKGLRSSNIKTDLDFYLHVPYYCKYNTHNYKIGYFYWEADKLPASWIANIKKLNEIWAPCELVKRACLEAGFNKKIRIVPTPCDDWTSDKKIFLKSPYSNEELEDDVYKFYSIFQWQNRKNYKTLLRAYYKAFDSNDKVLLIIKTTQIDSDIDKSIFEIKKGLNLKYYPPVFISRDKLPVEEIRAIHNTGDCFVLPHHGEGWGMPIHDAMLQGKQIITTKYGGITEWLSNDSAHIINHKMGPVKGMEWNQFYNSGQNWAHPDEEHLVSLFKDVYKNHYLYGDKSIKAKKIAKDFTVEPISKVILKELASYK